MRQPFATRQIDHPPGIGVPPGSEPDVGRPIDDPSPGHPDPRVPEPPAPEVDAPGRPFHEPDPGSTPQPDIDMPGPERGPR
jgi:hypothetical protein